MRPKSGVGRNPFSPLCSREGLPPATLLGGECRERKRSDPPDQGEKGGGNPRQRWNEDKLVSPPSNGKQCPGRRPPFAKTSGGNDFAAGAMTDFSGAGTLPRGKGRKGGPGVGKR